MLFLFFYQIKTKQTWAISSDVLIIRALLFKFATTQSTAIVMPRLRSIAFIPAATDLHPSVNIARVRTVAQVVPANTNKNIHITVFMMTQIIEIFIIVHWTLTVACSIICSICHLLYKTSTNVLDFVFEFNTLCYSHTILCHFRGSKALFQNNIASLWKIKHQQPP